MFKDVHFYLNSNYKWGAGWTLDESIAFESEIFSKFEKNGYKIKPSDISGGCARAIKGKTSLYLHPMEVSGATDISLIDEIERILTDGKTFSLRYTKEFDELFDWDDYEYTKYLYENKDEIDKDILSAFECGRLGFSMGYRYFDAIDEKWRKKTINSYIGRFSSDISVRFLEDRFNELIKEGKIIATNGKKGKIYRAA